MINSLLRHDNRHYYIYYEREDLIFIHRVFCSTICAQFQVKLHEYE